MPFNEIANAQVERYPEAKVEQVFETARTEIAAKPPDLTQIRLKAAAGIVFGYNEFQAIRAMVNGQPPLKPVSDISQIPKTDVFSVLRPALDAAASDAVADAILLHGATDTLSRALANIRATYDLILALLS